jgi:hypothetical protein
VRVPIYVRIVPSVSVAPPVVLLPAKLEGGQAIASLDVHAQGGELTGARVEPAGALTATIEGHQVTIMAGEAGAPKAAKLILTTTVPGEERVEVPLTTR